MIGIGSSGIKIDGHIGTWYVIDKSVFNYQTVYLLEHETYGDEAPCLIVGENLNLLLEDVWNGFADYEYYLSSEKEWKTDHEAIEAISQTAMYLDSIGKEDMADNLMSAMEKLKRKEKNSE